MPFELAKSEKVYQLTSSKKMTQDFYEKLENLLKKDSRFIDQEGDILKNNIIDAAYKADKALIEILLLQKEFKGKFFSKIKDTLVFNINVFVAYIQDKYFLNDSYTKYRNKIGLNIDGKFLNERKEVALVWPFKDCVLEGGMTKEDEKRKEIFFNEILAQDEIDQLFAPKVLTNWKRYTVKGGEEVKELKSDENGTIRENFIIKGNNLLALHSLKKQFQGKIKLIYIDPPYGKDADSFYNDNFKRSSWLTFMKNRLHVAKDLLANDGMIFIQIDEKQFAHLKVLADDIFNKFVTIITTKTRSDYGVAQEDFLYTVTEYILVYANSKPVNYEKYVTRRIAEDSKFFSQYNQVLLNLGTEEKYKQIETGKVGKVVIYKHDGFQINSIPKEKRNIEYYASNLDLIIRTSNSQGGFLQKIYQEIPEKGLYSVEYIPTKGFNKGNLFRYYILDRSTILWAKNLFNKADELERNVILTNLWEDISWLGIAHEGGVKLKNGKKPEALLKRILELSTKKGDIVLDYHAGSGTTCAVAHKMGRRYIGVEQLNYEINNPEERMKNVIDGDQTGISKIVNWKGGGDFIYCELAKYNEKFIDEIQRSKDTKKLLETWKEMKTKSFLNYMVKPEEFDKSIKEFKELSLVKQKEVLLSLLNKNQMYVNLSEMEDGEFEISKSDKEINKSFYER